MTPPEFLSRPLAAAVYDVTARTQLVVLSIGRGYVGVWVEGTRVGTARRFVTMAAVEEHMRAFRMAHDPDAPRPCASAPGGEPARIQPQSSMLIQEILEREDARPPERQS